MLLFQFLLLSKYFDSLCPQFSYTQRNILHINGLGQVVCILFNCFFCFFFVNITVALNHTQWKEKVAPIDITKQIIVDDKERIYQYLHKITNIHTCFHIINCALIMFGQLTACLFNFKSVSVLFDSSPA